jgi:hypothetical protein
MSGPVWFCFLENQGLGSGPKPSSNLDVVLVWFVVTKIKIDDSNLPSWVPAQH